MSKFLLFPTQGCKILVSLSHRHEEVFIEQQAFRNEKGGGRFGLRQLISRLVGLFRIGGRLSNAVGREKAELGSHFYFFLTEAGHNSGLG